MRKALRAERQAELAPLRDALDEASDPAEITRLERRIAEVEERFARREKEVGRMLF